jgi:mRNA-degrading endonuclease toxin of MazEF toxin-antitoxin module
MTKLTRRDFLAASAALAAAPSLLRAQDDAGLVVHEWGVVSVAYRSSVWAHARSAGSRALKGQEVKSDLPAFVATWEKAVGEQMDDWRMQPVDKPVVWFYSKKAMDVKFEVSVPKGRPKAWWPWASAFAPDFKGSPMGKGGLRRLDDDEQEPDITKMPQSPGRLVWEKLSLDPTIAEFPKAAGWWPDCRAVDATPFRFPDAPDFKWGGRMRAPHPLGKGVPQTEKFLFYDALTPFEPALDIEWSKDKVVVRNDGAAAIPALFAIRVRNGTCASAASAALAKGASVELKPADGEPALKDALVKAGLYEKEAAVVAGIWKEEFFQVDGARVLAITPPAVFDALLPATVTPTPKEFVRVLVTHVECLPHETRIEADRWIEMLSSESLDERDEAAKKLKALGPLAEHVVRRAAEKATDPETKARLMELLKR